MTYFGKTGRNVLTSAVCSAIISKLSLMRRHRKRKVGTEAAWDATADPEKTSGSKKKVVDKDDCL